MALKIKNLFAGYGRLEILKDVTLEVGSSEIVSIIGPNGAGKSTIIKSVFNIADVYRGKIEFNQEDIGRYRAHELHQKKIGYLNQGKVVFTNLTVRENLEIAATLAHPRSQIENEIEQILHFFPALKEKFKKLAFTLSGGQQQQLALGRALIQKPSLLLLDEPSLGLSPILQKELFNQITELKQQGISFLIVEQNAKSAILISDRTYLLENGQVVLEGGRDILKNPIIKKTYLGHD